MRTSQLIKFATEKEFNVNRFKPTQAKLRDQCFRLMRSQRLRLVGKTDTQFKFRAV